MGVALVVGFLTAIGWWGGNKVTAAIDGAMAQTTAQIQKANQK